MSNFVNRGGNNELEEDSKKPNACKPRIQMASNDVTDFVEYLLLLAKQNFIPTDPH